MNMLRLALLFVILSWGALAEGAPCDIQPIEIFNGPLTTTPNTVIYTVPTGKKVVVSSILIASNATGTTNRAVTIKGNGVSWVGAYGLSANTTLAFMTGIVMNAARTITAWQAVGTDVDLTLSGGLYTCP